MKKEKVHFIEMGHFKKPWSYLYQVAPLLKIFAKERPTLALSTGSGRTALVPFILSQFLKIRFVHIDTFSRVHGHSKFGTFMLKMRRNIYTQWHNPQNKKAIYIGPIFKQHENGNKCNDSKYVFVTLGTREEPFTRLIKGID